MRKSNKPKINQIQKDDLLNNPDYEDILFSDCYEKQISQFPKPHKRKYVKKPRGYKNKFYLKF